MQHYETTSTIFEVENWVWSPSTVWWDALDEFKQNKNYEKIKIELTTEELNVLVNRIYEYTIKLASENAVELTDDELRSSDNTILNLQNYLKAQKRIFEAAA